MAKNLKKIKKKKLKKDSQKNKNKIKKVLYYIYNNVIDIKKLKYKDNKIKKENKEKNLKLNYQMIVRRNLPTKEEIKLKNKKNNNTQ